MLNRLSIFAGGWSLEAAEAVCAGRTIDQPDVLDLLERRFNKSLVIAEEGPDGSERYRLLESVRQYARERLHAAGESDALEKRHAEYFVASHGPEELVRARLLLTTEPALLDQLGRELDNLRAALRWWITSQYIERALEQAEALFPIWYYRGSLSEGMTWVQEILALLTVGDAADLKLRGLMMLAYLGRRHGEYALALNSFNGLLAARKETGDKPGVVETLAQISNLHSQLADFNAAWAGWCRQQAAELGTHVYTAVSELLDQHHLHFLRQSQGIIRLAETYGAARPDAACRRALSYGNARYRTIKTILEKGLDPQLVDEVDHSIASVGAFLRGPDGLFDLNNEEVAV